jgi:multidrug resistance efflux pump
MSQVQRARDQLRYAQDTRQRLEPLLKPGFVTQQQLDEAKTNEAAAEASLQQVSTSSELLSYAGMQIAFAFF